MILSATDASGYGLCIHKYDMRPLQYILSFDRFILMSEEKNTSLSSCSWWAECIHQVKIWLFQDRTTTRDNLYEKAKNFARNYLCEHPELSSIEKDKIVREIADEVECDLNDLCFDQRPPAYVVAQKERNKIPEDPERKYLKLSP